MPTTGTPARKNIQILRGSKKYDPSTSEDTLLDGQPFYSKNTKQLFVGEDGQAIKNLKAVNDPENILFTKDIETAYTIGGVQGTPTNRRTLFKKGETLATALDRIFNPALQPTKTNPKITISLSPASDSGEFGSSWPTITPSISTTTGSYSYGPATGVTWSNEDYTYSGNSSGIYGGGDRTYSVTRTYSDGAVALDNKGNSSDPEVKITSNEASDTATFTENPIYRQFYGVVGGGTIADKLEALKDVQSSKEDGSLKTYLQNSNPTSIEIILKENGYIYFITKHTLKGATWGPLEFPIVKEGTYTFKNHYNKEYDVNVYKSANELTPEIYSLTLIN